jgi:hypothetical protein
MQTIAAKVKVNADRTVTVQLPADVEMGEYDAVLVLNNRVESVIVEESALSSEYLVGISSLMTEWESEADESAYQDL